MDAFPIHFKPPSLLSSSGRSKPTIIAELPRIQVLARKALGAVLWPPPYPERPLKKAHGKSANRGNWNSGMAARSGHGRLQGWIRRFDAAMALTAGILTITTLGFLRD